MATRAAARPEDIEDEEAGEKGRRVRSILLAVAVLRRDRAERSAPEPVAQSAERSPAGDDAVAR